MSTKRKILIADDSAMNREILNDMLGDEYEILEVENGQEAIAAIQKHGVEIDLMLLDIVMPKMDGFEVLSLMNKYHWIEDIPVIIISAETTPEAMHRAYDLCVSDYISRPFDEIIVHKRVSNAIMLYTKQKRLVNMVTDQIYEKEKSSSLMVAILSHIVEFRNGESGLHVIHINAITKILLQCLVHKTDKYPLTHKDISLISMASALHDIGKITIPDEILNKPGKLTNEEFAIMKTHSAAGATMIQGIPFQEEKLVKYAYEISRWHHERYDGRGYPDGLVGEDIPISAQVVSIADVYDALTSVRVYKRAFTHEEAMQMILNNECGVFNPLILECLKESADQIQNELKKSDANSMLKVEEDVKNMVYELAQHKELTSCEKTFESLDIERVKNQFFATLSQDILFEYSAMSNILVLSKNGAKHLEVEETILNPFTNEVIVSKFGTKNLEKVSQIIRNTTPENPVITYDFTMEINGKKKSYQIIARSIWSFDGTNKYVGAIGKVKLD